MNDTIGAKKSGFLKSATIIDSTFNRRAVIHSSARNTVSENGKVCPTLAVLEGSNGFAFNMLNDSLCENDKMTRRKKYPNCWHKKSSVAKFEIVTGKAYPTKISRSYRAISHGARTIPGSRISRAIRLAPQFAVINFDFSCLRQPLGRFLARAPLSLEERHGKALMAY